MTQTRSLQNLLKRLEAAGLSSVYVRNHILPEWWSDEIAENPVGYLEAVSYISKFLGVDLNRLLNDDAEIEPDSIAAHFMKRSNVSDADLVWSRSIAARAAQIVAYTMPVTKPPVQDLTAAGIRTDLLQRGERWVSFENLTRYCWEIGIPVIHVSNFPPKQSKMDGMAVNFHGRPVIVLGSVRLEGAWQVFYLAHELGHIQKNHLKTGDVISDDKISLNTSDEELNAVEDVEGEANKFAVELLTGSENTEFGISRLIGAERLVNVLRAKGREMSIDPGIVALNLARNYKHRNIWPLATKAVSLLEPDADAPDFVRSLMIENLDLEELPEDSVSFLLSVCSINEWPMAV